MERPSLASDREKAQLKSQITDRFRQVDRLDSDRKSFERQLSGASADGATQPVRAMQAL